MTDHEFDILDELYFVKSFANLQKELPLLESNLITELENLIQKGWIRILDEFDNEVNINDERFKNHEYKFNFIATKQGLKAHNQV